MSIFRSELTRRNLLWLGALAYPGKMFNSWNANRKAPASMSNIDIYTHFFPPAYGKEIIKRATRSHPDVPNIEMLMRFFPNLCEFDARLGHMDKYETSLQVLTPLRFPRTYLSATRRRRPPWPEWPMTRWRRRYPSARTALPRLRCYVLLTWVRRLTNWSAR